MPGGEEIGDAYIEVHADTRGLSRELKRAAQIAAAEFPKAFSKAVGSQIDDTLTPKGRRLRGAYSRAGKLSGKGWADAFASEIQGALGRLDRALGKGVLFGDWSSAISQFDDMDEAVAKISSRLRELHEANKDAFSDKDLSDAIRQLGKYADEVDLDRVVADARRLNVEFDKLAASEAKADARDRQREVRDLIRQQVEDVKVRNAQEAEAIRINDRMNTSVREQRRLYNEWGEERRVMFREMIEDLIRAGGGIDKFTKNTHVQLERLTKDLRGSLGDDAIDTDAFTRAMDSIEADVARGGTALNSLRRRVREVDNSFSILGRLQGSRNNFFNAVGIFGGIAERAVEKLAQAFLNPRGLIDAVKTFGDTVQTNGGGIQGFFSTIGQSISSFFGGGGDITALVKLGLVVAAVSNSMLLLGTALGVASAALSGLLGIATALAGSLSFAVAGFLLPLGPMALAAAAGVGALLVAFQGLEDELDKSVKPVTDWFDAIQKPVRENLFRNLSSDMQTFSETLNTFVGPLLLDAATALSGVFTYMVEALQRPEVQNTLTVLGETLPPILGALGQGFTDLVTGLLGFFAPISGFTVTIAQNLADMAKSFSDWANSVEGQDSIRTFFGEASESAQILWDLIVQVGAALGTMFSQGKETGDGFLQKITDIVQEFTDWANSDEGREKIASWMAFARDLAAHLWAAIEEVGRQIARLDTPQNRQILLFLIDAFTKLVGWVGNLAAIGSNWTFNIFTGLAKIQTAAENAMRALGDLFAKIRNNPLGSIVSGITAVAGAISGRAASGTILTGPTRIMAGEAGREAVIPLDRPLSMIDPSVRWMAAMIRGKEGPATQGLVAGGGQQLTVAPNAIQMVVPSAMQARQVASALLDELVGAAK